MMQDNKINILSEMDMTEYEEKYYKLLMGNTIQGNKLTIYELMMLMNNELNINTLNFQKSGRDTYYIRVDEQTKQYYLEKFTNK